MTLFDLIALVILLVSGLVGFTRGAVRELVTFFAFGFAAAAAVFLLPYSGPFLRDMMKPAWAGNAAAVVIVFVLTYIGFRLIGHWVTSRLHERAALGTVDRVVGLGFGVIRALVFLGVFYLVFNLATPPDLVPRWIADGKLYPLARASARAIQTVAPKALHSAGRLGPALERVVTDPDADDAPAAQSRSGNAPSANPGYDKRARDGIDALVERSR